MFDLHWQSVSAAAAERFSGLTDHGPLAGVELVTPPLEDMILPGVTRDSILTLARDHASGKRKLEGLPDNLTVSERNLTMPEIVEASKNGSLKEVFGSGTAAIVSCVDGIGYEGELIKVPCGEDGRARAISPPDWSVPIDA
ncbi:hypothetical protein JCM3770_003443 [Rhodotorula araucariae]